MTAQPPSNPVRKTVQIIPFETGAHLEVIDATRPLAGDRWQVAAVFRLVIPVHEALLAGAAEAEFKEIRRRLGDRIAFEKRLERIFIAEDRKDAIFRNMVRGYLEGALRYLSRPAFARNYVLRRYADARRKEAWYGQDGPTLQATQ
jgi:hypothetical protein